MAKKGKLRPILTAIEEASKNANAPKGFFSTLDEAIVQAPFERGPKEQWQNYLKPGREVDREGIKFPLKQEEIDYTDLSKVLDRVFADDAITRDDLLTELRNSRPWIETDSLRNSGGTLTRLKYEHYPRLSHNTAPSAIPKSYDENLTESPNFGEYSTHFNPETLSWSRTTSHNIPDGPLRLIEEIQSDRHSAAGEKRLNYQKLPPDIQEWALRTPAVLRDPKYALDYLRSHDPGSVPAVEAALERQGYRKPYAEAWLDWATENGLRDKMLLEIEPQFQRATGRKPGDVAIPDAPWKSPADYGRFELKKQLYEAAQGPEEFLAITPASVQIDRYEGAMGEREKRGMEEIYDRVYPSELKKLARQYNLPFVEGSEGIPWKTVQEGDWRPEGMIDAGYETVNAMMHSNFYPDEDDVGKLMMGADAKHDLPIVADQMARNLRQHGYLRLANGLTSLVESLFNSYRESDSVEWDDFRSVLHKFEEAERVLEGLHPKSEGETRLPAVRILDREKIQRVGVPLWAAAGATSLSQMLDEDPEGYAEGGKIRGLKNVLNAYEQTGRRLRHSEPYLDLLDRRDFEYPAPGTREFGAVNEWIESPSLNTLKKIRELVDKYSIPVERPLYRGVRALNPLQPFFVNWLRSKDVEIGPRDLTSATTSQKVAKEFGETLVRLEPTRRLKAFPILGGLAEDELIVPSDWTKKELIKHYEQDGFDWNRDPRLIAAEMRVQRKAEGGEVSKGPSTRPKKSRSTSQEALRLLRKTAETMDAGTNDNRKRLLLGLASQIWGTGPEGKPTLDFLPRLDFDGPPGSITMSVPGLVDSTASIAAVPAMLASAVTGDEYRGPEFADRAQNRVDQLDTSLRSELGVTEPSTTKDNFLEFLGMMLGQIPVGAAKPVKGSADLLTRGALSGVEWFSPTIRPSMTNYLVGAGFPTALSTEPVQNTMVEAIRGLRSLKEKYSEEEVRDGRPRDHDAEAGP